MPKQLLKLLAILFAVALVAAACGSDDDDSSSETSTEEEGAAEEEASEEEATEEAAEEEATEEATEGAAEEEATEEPTEEPEEELTASDVGVTEDTITVGVIVADLDPLIESGFSLPAALSTDHLAQRWIGYFDDWNAEGGINGRMIEGVTLIWDPLDSSTMEDTCTKATLDNELFMVMNGNGYNTSFIPCFTEDADMPFLFGEMTSQSQVDRSPERLFFLNPPSEVAAVAGVQGEIDKGRIAEGDTIGILSTADTEGTKDAAAAAQATLEENGMSVEVIEVATLDVDPAVTNAESASAVSEFQAAGVDHVFVFLGFTTAAGFWAEYEASGAEFGTTVVDAAASMCTPFGASRSAAPDGTLCVTAYDSHATPGGTEIRADTPEEAQCREEWLSHFGEEFNDQSDPGVPSGEAPLVTSDGEELYSDFQSSECNLAHIFKEALTNAGVNPTRDSFAEAIRQVSGAQSSRSESEGTFGPDKNYYATKMHDMVFRAVDPETPRGDDGTFNGCPAPTNCWIPADDVWVAIEG